MHHWAATTWSRASTKSTGLNPIPLTCSLTCDLAGVQSWSRRFGGGDGEGVVAEAGDEVEFAAEGLHVATASMVASSPRDHVEVVDHGDAA